MENKILSMGFNQINDCFAIGTTTGFETYSCNPFSKLISKNFGKGIAKIEMLYKCNIFAFVGGGENPKYSPNHVIIWDDFQNKEIGTIPFKSEVKGVKLTRDRIIVILEYKVYIYNFSDLKLINSIETTSNPNGLVSISSIEKDYILATLGLEEGHMRIETTFNREVINIPAHKSAITYYTLNTDGMLLATASEAGTLIRIFSTYDGKLLREFRRGITSSKINNISFSDNSEHIAVSSDKGTVHLYSLKTLNPLPALSFMGNFLPSYFSNETSFAKFYIPDVTSDVKAITCFQKGKNCILVLCDNGISYNVEFAEDGTCTILDSNKFNVEKEL
jgi:WD40 repeat protein